MSAAPGLEEGLARSSPRLGCLAGHCQPPTPPCCCLHWVEGWGRLLLPGGLEGSWALALRWSPHPTPPHRSPCSALPGFPTNTLEMSAVASIFDLNGDGYIDYYEFVSTLHPSRDILRRTADVDQIQDEVRTGGKGATFRLGRILLRGKEKEQEGSSREENPQAKP